MTWRRSRLYRHLAASMLAATVLPSPAGAFDFQKVTFGIGVGPYTNDTRATGIGLVASPDTAIHVGVLARVDLRRAEDGRSIHLHVGYKMSDRTDVELSALGNQRRYDGLMTLLHITANLGRRIGRPPGPWFMFGGIGHGFDPTHGNPSGPAISAGLGRRLGRVFDLRLVADCVVHMRDPDITDYKGESRTVALLIGLARR